MTGSNRKALAAAEWLKLLRFLPVWAARWLSSREGSLKERAARGGVWLLLADAANRIAGLLKLAVLGRLLTPRDFGLVGIALLVEQFIGSFTQTGINAALIQKKEDIRDYLDSAWTVQLIRGVVVAALIFLAAPVGTWFFQDPEAIPMIRAIGLLPLFFGFTNPAVVYLRKELDFRKDVLWRSSGVLVGLLTGITLALIYRNAWALILSLVAGRMTETITSYWIYPYRPRIEFAWARVRELLEFGKWIFWLNMLGYFERSLGSLATSKFLGTVSLGYLQLADRVATFVSKAIGTHAHGVLFPAFSKIRDPQRHRRAFFSALTLLSSLVVPVGCFVAVLAGPLVSLILGEKWLVICPAVRFLAWEGAATALAGITGPLFLSLGQPKWSLAAQAVRLSLLAGLLYPLLKSFEVTGVALALMISSVIATCFRFLVAKRLLSARFDDMIPVIKTTAFSAAPFVVVAAFAGTSFSVLFYLAVAAATGTSLIVFLTVLRSHFNFDLRSARIDQE